MVKILHIEDDPDIARLVMLELGDLGHMVVSAGNVAEGFAKAAIDKPAVILTDLRLPDIEEDQVIPSLSTNPATRDIPIIALTAHKDEETHIRALRAGCKDIATKPITNFEDLNRKIRAVLVPPQGRPPGDSAV
jgi:two-component system cell cycle response regulator DivK